MKRFQKRYKIIIDFTSKIATTSEKMDEFEKAGMTKITLSLDNDLSLTGQLEPVLLT